MSEVDEGLDEILKYNISGNVWSSYTRISEEGRIALKQDILDLMCKLRGCEPENPQEIKWPRYSYDDASWEKEGPCIWCGKEKG